jgi:hypothetical protein
METTMSPSIKRLKQYDTMDKMSSGKRIDGAAKQKSKGADLPFNIYHVELRFFQINLNVKQRQIFNKMQNLIFTQLETFA